MFIRINNLIQPLSDKNTDSFLYWRELIFNAVFLLSVTLGAIVFFPGLLYAWTKELWSIVIAYIVFYTWLCSYGVTRRMVFLNRILITVVLLYVVGLVLVFSGVYYQAGLIWLFIFPLLVAFLLSIKATVIALCINLVTFVIIGFFIRQKAIPCSITGVEWIVNSLNFLAINTVTSVTVSFLMYGLKTSLETEHETGAMLSDERDKLARSEVMLKGEIEERKRAEEKLKSSEELYRAVFENSGTSIMLIEDDMTISKINSRAEMFMGFAKNEIETKIKFTEFLSTYDLERLKQYHIKRRQGGDAPKSYEFDFIEKSGSIRHCHMNIDVIPGTTTSVASVIDITEFKETREELRKQEERLTIALETTSDGIWDWFPVMGVTVN